MEKTTHPLIALAQLTIADPQAAARRIMALDLPRPALWQGFALVVIASVLLSELATLMIASAMGIEELLRLGPWGSAALQALFVFLMVVAIHRIGAAFGGTGGWDDTLKLVLWLQAMLVAFQAVQFAVMLVAPGIASILGMLATGWFFWVLTAFVMVLHGFRSRGRVFLGILLSFVAFVVVMSMILTSLGIIELVPGGAQ